MFAVQPPACPTLITLGDPPHTDPDEEAITLRIVPRSSEIGDRVRVDTGDGIFPIPPGRSATFLAELRDPKKPEEGTRWKPILESMGPRS